MSNNDNQDIKIDTTKAIANVTLYVGARTQASQSPAYMSFSVRVIDCREEKVNFIDPLRPIDISLTVNSSLLVEKEILGKFESSHSFCPITSIKIMKVMDNESNKKILGYETYLSLNSTSGVLSLNKTSELID